jgi:hypothetical protein
MDVGLQPSFRWLYRFQFFKFPPHSFFELAERNAMMLENHAMSKDDLWTLLTHEILSINYVIEQNNDLLNYSMHT